MEEEPEGIRLLREFVERLRQFDKNRHQ